MRRPFTLSSDYKILQSLQISQVSYTNDAGYWPIWLTAKFWKKCWCICWKGMRTVVGSKRHPTMRMRLGREKPQGGEGQWHPWGPWEEGKESTERLSSEGGTLAKKELPPRGTGLLTPSLILLQTVGWGAGEGERERIPMKSLLQNSATTSPSLSTSYRDTMMKTC